MGLTEPKQKEKCAGELVSVPKGGKQGSSCSFPMATFLLMAGSIFPATLCGIWTICQAGIVLAELSEGLWDALGEDEGR